MDGGHTTAAGQGAHEGSCLRYHAMLSRFFRLQWSERILKMAAASKNSLGARDTLTVGNQGYEIYRLEALERKGIGHVSQLPFSIRILLENLLRQEDGRFV